MKKYLLLLAAASMFAFSCTKSETDTPEQKKDDPVDPTPTTETINSITATLTDAATKTAWADGDAIIVYAVTESGDVTAKYVLASGAGSTNGTFNVEGTGVATGASAYYASYPYNEDLVFAQHNTFSFTLEAEQTAANPAFGSSTDGKAYTISSPLAGIEFKLTGKGNAAKLYLEDKNTDNIINGNFELNAKNSKSKIKNSSSSKNTVAKSFETVALSDSPASFFMEVPAGTLEQGASLTVYNPANGMIGLVDVPAQTLTAGKLTTISLSLEAVSSVAELSATESANCYIITEPGEYKFKTVRGNSAENVGTCASAEILWESYGNQEEVVANSVIASAKYESDYVTFKTPETLHNGNALIAVKDAEGVILWSWHIWVTDKTIEATDLGFGDGGQVMNYNLGATGECGTPESFGLLYQWGRKDPFIGGGAIGHSEPATVSGIEMTTTAEQGKVSTEFADQNPTTFVIVAGSDGNKDWLDVSDGTRWSTTKAMYDPCPAGWRIPSGDESGFFSGDIQIVPDYGEETSQYFFTVNSSYNLPLAPSRGYTDGSVSKSDTKFFTCSGADGEYGKALRISGGTSISFGIRRKAEACSIRCVKDVAAEE